MEIQRKPMAMLTIWNLDPAVKERLRVQAARRGHSMEAEARLILRDSLQAPEPGLELNLYARIRARFAPFGGVDDLEIPPRETGRDPPDFS